MNEPFLKEVLLILLEQLKQQGNLLVALTAEVSALRFAVRGLDPTFDDVLEKERNLAKTRTDAIFDARTNLVLDELIRRLESGEYS